MESRIEKINAINAILSMAEQDILTATGYKLHVMTVPYGVHKDLMPEEFVHIVGTALRLTPQDMKCRDRIPHLVLYRQLCCKLLRDYYKELTLKRIAAIVGLGDHSTVLHGIKQIENLMAVRDDEVMQKYNWALDAITQWEAIEK